MMLQAGQCSLSGLALLGWRCVRVGVGAVSMLGDVMLDLERRNLKLTVWTDSTVILSEIGRNGD